MIALVLGTGPTLWSDLQAAQWIPFDEVCVVNQAGVLYPGPFQAWASGHPEKFCKWRRQRAMLEQPACVYKTYSRRHPHGSEEKVDQVLNQWGKGSSGLYGVRVEFHRGAGKIVLCGIPLTPEPHVAGSVQWGDREWTECHHHREGWERVMGRIEGRVKSFSGWTRELLGPPSPEWVLDA